MNGQPIEFIADTSAIFRLCRGAAKLAEQVSGQFFAITFVTMAEFAVGVLKSNKPEAVQLQISKILENKLMLRVSPFTPAIYARLYVDLEKNCALIPNNDIWIAALAIEAKLQILARDEHFHASKI
jgi:predicted nucleic acid-binding protein